MTVGVLVLAAGRSRRFGADKRQALLPDGRRVIDATLDNIIASGLPFLVCVDQNDHELFQSLESQGFDCRRCERAGEGMGATLAEGVSHVKHWSGVLVALADMPWVIADTYALLATHIGAERMVVPVYHGQRGHPVGFGREFYPELSSLRGDSGARRVLVDHAGDVREVKVSDSAIHRDIDIPTDMSFGG